MILLSHPTGNAFVRHALQALQAQGLLHSFHTTLAWPTGWGPSVAARRSFPIPWGRIHCHPFPEALRLLGILRGPSAVDHVYTQLDLAVSHQLRSQRPPSAVYAYEDGALESFRVARSRGITTVYDLPIGHYATAQQIFQEEAAREPLWASTLQGLADSPRKLERKAQELSLAQHIIVASAFTASTLQGQLQPHQSLSVIPYGTHLQPAPPARPTTGPLRILYVGALTQRKGLSYLFQALQGFPRRSYTLTLIGRTVAPCPVLQAHLQQHHHIPSLPHAHILSAMRAHDILVFPSLFEGFGLVLTEALSCGLPIIATAHTAAPALITHGQQGFIVPIRSSQSIAHHLQWALDNRPALAAMQQAAWQRAQTLGWPSYQKALIMALKPLC